MMSPLSKEPNAPDDPAPSAPGSRAPLSARLARHVPILENRVRRLVGARPAGIVTASDLAQDAWVAALEADRRGKGPAPSQPAEAAWLGKILRNKIRETFRRARAAKRGGGMAAAQIEPDEIPAPGTSPSARLLRSTREEHLMLAMDSLPDRDQQVLKLTFLEGKSRKEVALLLGVGEHQVGNRYREALRRLREAYEHRAGPWDPS